MGSRPSPAGVDLRQVQALAGNRATLGLLAGRRRIQRAVYLANQDDLIYKHSSGGPEEYAFVQKASDRSAYYLEYGRLVALQKAVAALAPKFPNERKLNQWFDELVGNARGGDADAQTVLNLMGPVLVEENNVMTDVTARLAPVVLGHFALTAGTNGPQYNNVGGGSRLPRASGMLLVRNDVDRKAMLQWLGVDDETLSNVEVKSFSAHAMASAAQEMRGMPGTFTNVLELKADPKSPQPDMVYGSTVRVTRSANARVICAGATYADDLHDLLLAAAPGVAASFNALPAVTADSGWVPGTRLVTVDRGEGQVKAMKGWNALGAAAFANRQGLGPYDLGQNWEWLHVQGAQIGGATTGGNLVAGLYVTNSLMIPYETMVARWAQADPTHFWARFTATPAANGFASEMAIWIAAKDHQALGDFGETKLISFDPLAGRVVDKVANEMIKREMDRTHKVS